MDANADNAAEEIHSYPPPEVSVTRHSLTESVVQALVADQSVLDTLSQAILSVIKQDLPDHAIHQSRAEKAAAPAGQSAEHSAVESVDQTGKVKATKRHLPIDVVVTEENTQSKRPRGDKSTPYASSLQADQSSAKEDYGGPLSPNSRWEPSEELDTLLKALLKPLQRFERRTIIRESPRPASEGAFTPNLDTCLNSMISGAKTLDNSLRDIQDKILDVLGPLCALHENLTLMQESMENEEIILDKATVDAMFGCVKKAIMLVGDTSTQVSSKRREQVLTKLNPVLASLGKEDFPDSGKQLFGDGFESRLKLRSETANTVADAKKAGKSFFRGTAPQRFHEVNTEPPTEASFAPHQVIRPQAHHSGAGAEPHLPSPKGHISQNHINSSGSPKSPSLRYVQKLFEFPQRPASGRPIETFFSSMGTDHKGPLGPPSSLRLSNRVSSQSCTTIHHPHPPIPCSLDHQTIIDQEVWELLSKEAVHFVQPDSLQEPGFISSLFVIPKKGGGHRLFHPIRTLQNGVHTHVKRSFKERRLHGENGPERRISDSPNMAESPKVPKVSVEGFTSGIRMPPLRFSKCPKGIHKIVKTSVVYTETKKNSTHCIPRRYPSYGALSGADPSACCFDSKSSRGARLYSELPKVGTSSFPTNGVPRVTRKLTRPKPQPPQRQNKEDPIEMPGSVNHPGYYCKGIPGPPVLIHTGSLSSSPPLSVPPTSEKLCPQISQILRSCSPSRLGVPPGGTVVERQSSSMEWESPVPTINRLGHRDRCLTSRLGSLLSRDVDRRQMAPRRDFIPYQLPRIASRLTSHNVLHQEQSQGSGSTADGQHFNSTYINKMGGTHSPCYLT